MKSTHINASIEAKKLKIKSNFPYPFEEHSEDTSETEKHVFVDKRAVDSRLAKSYFKTISFCKDLQEFISQKEHLSDPLNLFGFKEQCVSYDLDPVYFPSNSSKYTSLFSDVYYLGVQEAINMPIGVDSYAAKPKFVVKISFEHVDLSLNTIEATLKMQSSSSFELSKTVSEWDECNFDIETWLSGQIIGRKFQFTLDDINAERDRKGWVRLIRFYFY